MNAPKGNKSNACAELGAWLLAKWHSRLLDSGGNYLAVARQMRKQGYPLEVARAVLLGSSP